MWKFGDDLCDEFINERAADRFISGSFIYSEVEAIQNFLIFKFSNPQISTSSNFLIFKSNAAAPYLLPLLPTDHSNSGFLPAAIFHHRHAQTFP